ncbi:MAG TPA: FGGY family carbohydrate kinase [Chitinophagaceae bacterium]|nr:FGGY family carbohydrate kinase [Chitinophagaceae bacterium]
MKKLPVIVIFDIGKTNKKLLLFDEEYNVAYENSIQLEEITDEDNFPCEDVHALTNWMKESFNRALQDNRFEIRAVNFSGYGASFVLLDENLGPFLPLYNYLKPYPEQLQKQFYNTYGGESLIAKQTASPVLGSLNSGMQLYRLKYQKPGVFRKIKYALHLPQYLSFIFTGKAYSDITSIGCHTHLWDFQHHQYHAWVTKEGIDDKLAVIAGSDSIGGYINRNIPAGIGLHDSSAALIPYLMSFAEPFILLSTGTWCISLNPFNPAPLSGEELKNDCLNYLSYKGEPVKASRLFAGYEHEEQAKRLAAHFHKDPDYCKTIAFNPSFIKKAGMPAEAIHGKIMMTQSDFSKINLSSFENYEEAYHRLVADIILRQVYSTDLVLKNSVVKKIFVDGGFSNNPVYMQLLADACHEMEVYAAEIPQASALGAAFIMHRYWNSKDYPVNLIRLKHYQPTQNPVKK